MKSYFYIEHNCAVDLIIEVKDSKIRSLFQYKDNTWKPLNSDWWDLLVSSHHTLSYGKPPNASFTLIDLTKYIAEHFEEFV